MTISAPVRFRPVPPALREIRKTGTVRVPDVFTYGISGDRSFLLMEYLEAAPAKKDSWERFGRQLAGMHRADPSEWTGGGRYGFPEDNYIGSGIQKNDIRERWIDFFRECRLEVQFKRAEQYFDASGRKQALRLLEGLDQYLTEPAAPRPLRQGRPVRQRAVQCRP